MFQGFFDGFLGLFFYIFMALLIYIDICLGLFKKLAGVEKLTTVDGDVVNITDYFLQADAVQKTFWGIFAIAVTLCAICLIISILKTMFSLKDDKKSHLKSAGQGIMSVVTTIVLFTAIITGIALSNTALGYVNESFPVQNENLTMGKRVFELCVEDGYELDLSKPLYIDENENGIQDEGEETYGYEFLVDENGELVHNTGWANGNTIDDISLSDDYSDIFGNVKFGLITIPQDSKAKVYRENFNLLHGIIAAFMLSITFTIALLSLVKRIYDIVILFLAMPFVVATIPLDDGARFKLWRETLISKVVIAFSVVVSVNCFIIFMSLANNLYIEGLGVFQSNLFSLFLIIGGALSIGTGAHLIARIVGTSAEESREMMQSFGQVVRIGMLPIRMSRAGIGTAFRVKEGLDRLRRGGNGSDATQKMMEAITNLYNSTSSQVIQNPLGSKAFNTGLQAALEGVGVDAVAQSRGFLNATDMLHEENAIKESLMNAGIMNEEK